MAKRVLVVDDHVPTRTLIRTVIEAEKIERFEVFEAGTGRDCLRIADKHGPFDLVLLDVILPDIDGYAVCRALRHADEVVPIVFVSVAGDLKDCARGRDAGGDSYLVKPITRTVLSSTVRLFTSITRAEGRGGPSKGPVRPSSTHAAGDVGRGCSAASTREDGK